MFGLVVASHEAKLVQTRSGRVPLTTVSRKLAEDTQLGWVVEAWSHSLLDDSAAASVAMEASAAS